MCTSARARHLSSSRPRSSRPRLRSPSSFLSPSSRLDLCLSSCARAMPWHSVATMHTRFPVQAPGPQSRQVCGHHIALVTSQSMTAAASPATSTKQGGRAQHLLVAAVDAILLAALALALAAVPPVALPLLALALAGVPVAVPLSVPVPVAIPVALLVRPAERKGSGSHLSVRQQASELQVALVCLSRRLCINL